MNILVLVKQVVDVELNIRVKEGKVVEDGLTYVISNWDEIAIEAALQINEKVGGEVTLVSIGPDRAVDALRKGLAMGAHKAIHVKDDALEGGDSYATATALAKVVEGRNFDVILAGKQAQDTDYGCTASMLAEMLGIPQVTNVAKIEAADGKLTVLRKGDHGNEVVEAQTPVLLTSNDSLNEPRLASLRGIMQAKKKPLETLSLSDLGLDASAVGAAGSKVAVKSFEEPPQRKAGQKFEGDEAETTKQVIDLLVKEAKMFA